MSSSINKAVISNRIYLRGTPELIESIKKKLTYKIETKIPGRGGKPQLSIEIIRNYKVLPKDVLSIPRGRRDLIPSDYEIVDKTITHSVPFTEPRFPLRPDQLENYDQANSDFFLNGKVGWGKTFTALHVAKKLGQKTLVICHTTFIRDQWIKEVQHLFGFRPGVVSADEFDIDNAIVIGNVQTLTKHSLKLAKE